MPRPNTFRDLESVRRERGRLLLESDRRASALGAHWRMISTPDFRHRVIGNTLTDILRSVRPMEHLGAVLRPGPGAVGTALGLGLGLFGKSPMAKLVFAGLGAAMPMVTERLLGEGKGRRILSELGRSWERIKERFEERRAERSTGNDGGL